ncbi:MAG: hypothetical protein IJD93_06175 [Ruminococcus sp.]|nr:hypothetical protein [Ruminococcus sp.]
MVKALQKSRAKHNEKLSYEDALEELVCNTMSDIATDEDAMAVFLELDESERKTLISVLRNIANKIIEWGRSLTGNEYRRLVTESEALRHLANELNKQLKAVEGNTQGQGERKNNAPDNEGIGNIVYDADSIIVDLSDDNVLSERVKGVYGANKYKIIQEYILEALSEQPITLSDGKQAVVDNRDALHIANKSANRKTAEISKIKYLVESAKLYAEATEVEHKKFNYFCYYKVSVRYNGAIYDLYINVGRAKNDGRYHIYDITKKIKDTANRINGLERPKPNEGYALQNGISNIILPNSKETVKKNFYADTIDLSADYDNAVEEYLRNKSRENLNNVRELVNKVASRAMPDSVVRDESGRLLKVYHGTESENFNVFDRERRGQTDASLWGRGYYFSSDVDFASDFGENVRGFYLNITKPFVVDKVDAPASIIAMQLKSMGIGVDFDYRGMKAYEFVSAFGNQRFTNVLMEKGYDGVIVEDFEYVAFEQNQMKLADAITYDDNGDVIPLSERFADNKNDIRYSYNDDSFRDIEDDIYYPKSARERSAFKRSMANKTSALQDGEIKHIIIYTADNFYVVTANGYLSGVIDVKIPLDGNREIISQYLMEEYDNADTTSERFSRWSQVYGTQQGRSNRSGNGTQNGTGSEKNDELDSGQSDGGQVGSDSTFDRDSQVKKSFSYADEDVDLWGLLEPEEETADSTQRSELLDGFIQTAGVLLEKTRGTEEPSLMRAE